MRSDKVTDLLATLAIAVVGLLAAYVTFGVLDSQATGEAGTYQVGGAIAGFLVTVITLGSLYMQQRKSSGELADLRRKNAELQQKLIRSITRPENFEVEVDERLRVVLARPRDWTPRGGVLFDFELSDTAKKPDDEYPARFALSFAPIRENTDPRDAYYAKLEASHRRDYEAALAGVPTFEILFMGDEPQPIRSHKTLWCEYALCRVKIDSVTHARSFHLERITRHRYEYELGRGAESASGSALESAASDGVQSVDDQVAGGAPVTSEPSESATGVVSAPAPITSAVSREGRGGPSDDPAGQSEVGRANDGIQTEDAARDQAASAPKARASSSEAEYPLMVQRMNVTCYHAPLQIVFFFNFYDDADDFPTSSADFNQLLRTTRFLT